MIGNAESYLKSAIFFFEIKNLFNQTYVASANNISDTISSVTGLQNPGSVLAITGTGSIYAGTPLDLHRRNEAGVPMKCPAEPQAAYEE